VRSSARRGAPPGASSGTVRRSAAADESRLGANGHRARDETHVPRRFGEPDVVTSTDVPRCKGRPSTARAMQVHRCGFTAFVRDSGDQASRRPRLPAFARPRLTRYPMVSRVT
jgi:hypothetical protein